MTTCAPRPRIAPPPALGEVLERIGRVLGPEQVWALDDPRDGPPASGVWELVAVIPDTAPPAHDDLRTAWEASRTTRAQVDLVVMRRSDLEASWDLVNTAAHRLSREGVVLWERPAPT